VQVAGNWGLVVHLTSERNTNLNLI
jgi:hypothetical protein